MRRRALGTLLIFSCANLARAAAPPKAPAATSTASAPPPPAAATTSTAPSTTTAPATASSTPPTTAPVVRSPGSSLERVAVELSTRAPPPPAGLLVASGPMKSDEPLSRGDELLFRILSVASGKLPGAHVHREPVSLAQARALAGRSGGLLYLDVAIDKGKLRVVADVYPAVSNAWERLKNPLPEPQGHQFIEVPIDAEVRSFLPPILLERAAIHRARIDDDVVALGCGDVDGDGGLDLVLVSDKRVVVGHARGNRFVVDKSAPLSRLAARAPVPLREPLASVVISGNPRDDAGTTRFWIGTTDYGAVALDAALAKTRTSSRIPLFTERGVMCATPSPETSAFEGPLVACNDEIAIKELAVPAAHFDAYAFFETVGKNGAALGTVVAAREPGGKLRLSKADAAATLEGIGSEIALSDLDQDGIVEIVTSQDGNEDAITVQSWDGGVLRPRLHLAAPAGVRALSVCPPENHGAPFIAAVVGNEVWLVR